MGLGWLAVAAVEEGVEDGEEGEEGFKLVGGSVFGRCARAPVPWWRIGSPGSQARAPENTATNQVSRRSWLTLV